MTISKTTQYITDPNVIPVETSTGSQTLQEALNDRANSSNVFLTENLTVNIPTDYPTLQEAIDGLSTLSVKNGATIILFIETGHALTSGLLVENGDYGRFTIQSADAEVTLDISFSGITVETTQPDSIIVGNNARMPVLDCLINAGDLGGAGYFAFSGSIGRVTAGNGVIFSGGFGLYAANGSQIEATSANFSSAGRGNRITTNSRLNAPMINLANARALNGASGVAALDVSRGSFVNIMSSATTQADLSNSAQRGLAARRSYVSATQVNVSGAGTNGVRAETGSTIVFNEGLADNCESGIFCDSSFIFANNASVDNATGTAVLAQNGSTVECGGVTITGGGFGINAISASNISCNGVTISGVSNNGISASDGSRIDASSCTISNSGLRGVACSSGATISLRSSSVTDSTGDDLWMNRAAYLNAYSCTTTSGNLLTDSNASVLNDFSGSLGILWG